MHLADTHKEDYLDARALRIPSKYFGLSSSNISDRKGEQGERIHKQ